MGAAAYVPLASTAATAKAAGGWAARRFGNAAGLMVDAGVLLQRVLWAYLVRVPPTLRRAVVPITRVPYVGLLFMPLSAALALAGALLRLLRAAAQTFVRWLARLVKRVIALAWLI